MARCTITKNVLASRALGGFTLIELLVVMVIISVLLGAVFAVSTTVISNAKSRNTVAVLQTVREALEAFKQSQSENPTFTRARYDGSAMANYYSDRYGLYPPDEMEPLTAHGLLNPATGKGLGPDYTILPPRTRVVPELGNGNTNYDSMLFYHQTGGAFADNAYEHRDLVAMMVTLKFAGGSVAEILNHVPKRFRRSAPIDSSNNDEPLQYIDRWLKDPGGGGSGTPPNPQWRPAEQGDESIEYIVDAWGVPITYLNQRDYDPLASTPENTESKNHPAWNQAATEMVRLNNGRPILMSYGPDGKDQLTNAWMAPSTLRNGFPTGDASIVADWMGPTSGGGPRRLDHPLNMDNIFPDQEIKDKLIKGIGGSTP